ncbi:hypothetical protein F183_A15370 [Bryobacterales bacterium F-183]|nr:hypothetical protein F183_A15370 [Bryobacterales bacterium F-183]
MSNFETKPVVVENHPRNEGVAGKVVLGVALVAALGGLAFQTHQSNAVRDELAKTHQQMDKMRTEMETSVTAVKQENTATMNETIAKLNAETAAAQKAAQRQLQIQANARALTAKQLKELTTRNEEMTSRLEDWRKSNEEKATQVDESLNTIKTDVGSVQTQVASTKDELDRTITDLKRMTGDMGVMSGLIATNASELDALKKLGERDYYEFTLDKNTKGPQKVGNIQLALKKADVKKSRFTVNVIADDRTVEKKDKNVNEPVQFYTSQARMPLELVINQISKDKVSGYLAVPKVKESARRS